MGKRRAARERALRGLFALEFNDVPSAHLLAASAGARTSAGDEAYALRLIDGIRARRDEVDALIEGTSRNWRVARMAVVERNILRVAVFEMLEDAFLAPAIIINEALEIAKRYSGEEAAVFINGILDAVRRKIRPDESPEKRRDSHERTEKKQPSRASGRTLGRRPGPQ
jgi:N utilization substance protein B